MNLKPFILPTVVVVVMSVAAVLSRKPAEPLPYNPMAPQAAGQGQISVLPPALSEPALPVLAAAQAPQPMAFAQMGQPNDGAVAAQPVDRGPKELLTPNYMARKLKVFEAHWQGLDGRLMTGELARKLSFPAGTRGLLVGEVTLNAALSGVLAGDVVTKVEETPVVTVEDFHMGTRQIASRNEGRLTVLRKDSGPQGPILRTMVLVIRAEGGLGFAQMEGAPMILPGDPRPHSYRGPCTECHPIGKGFELTPDPDLISLPPPQITRDAVAKAMSPHENRGPCEACHLIK